MPGHAAFPTTPLSPEKLYLHPTNFHFYGNTKSVFKLERNDFPILALRSIVVIKLLEDVNHLDDK